MASSICERSKSDHGIFFETWSGDNNGNAKNADCFIKKKNPVYHCIKVLNLKTIPMDIHVRGEIRSTINKAKFQDTISVTDKRWDDIYQDLESKGEKVFSHVMILPTGVGFGQEKIHTFASHETLGILKSPEIRLVFDVRV